MIPFTVYRRCLEFCSWLTVKKRSCRGAACAISGWKLASSLRSSLNDRGATIDLRTTAHGAAALSSGIGGSLIKFSVIEGLCHAKPPAELACFIENRHKVPLDQITFRVHSNADLDDGWGMEGMADTRNKGHQRATRGNTWNVREAQR